LAAENIRVLADGFASARELTDFNLRTSLGPQISGHVAQTTNLNSILDNLTKLLCMLVSQSFIVAIQPEPVLKTQHKFLAEVRLLIGDKLGIKQHLVNTNVTVRIIAEEEARLLSTAQLSEKNVKTVGSISNDFEKITTDDKGHMSAKFSNSVSSVFVIFNLFHADIQVVHNFYVIA
uniref:STAT_bind domain-containing protein n=1 Tax=Brugia timori TaxID=42155 RepID=A0A0R3QIF8_9BILA